MMDLMSGSRLMRYLKELVGSCKLYNGMLQGEIGM